MKKFLRLVLILIVLLILFGLGFYMVFKIPEVKEVSDVEVISASDTAIEARVAVSIMNENFFSLSAKELEYEVFYKDQKMGVGQPNHPVKLASKSETTVQNTVWFSFEPMMDNAEELMTADKVEMDFIISGKFSALGVYASTKVTNEVDPNEMSKLLAEKYFGKDAFKMKNVKIEKAGLEETYITMDLEIHNRLPVGAELKKMNLNVYDKPKSKKLLGKWMLTEAREIPAKGKVIVPARVKLNNKAMAQSVLTKIFKKKLSFYLKGEGLIFFQGKEMKLPIEQELEVAG